LAQGKPIQHRGQHAHVVAAHPVHAAGGGGKPTIDIAATDHEAELDTEFGGFADIAGDAVQDVNVNTVAVPAHQGLAGQLDEDSAVAARLAVAWLCHQPISPTTSLGTGCGGGDVCREIAVRPVDAFAKGEAMEACDLDWRASALFGGGERLGDGRLRIVDEGLRKEDDLLVEFAQAPLDHLLDDRGRLAGLFRLLGQHGTLALNEGGVESRHINALWIGGGDVDGYLLAVALEVRRIARLFKRDAHPDLAKAGRDGVVHVARYDAALDAEIAAPAKRHVLADRADHRLEIVGDGSLAAAIVGLGELAKIAFDLQRVSGDVAHHLLELVVP